MRGMERLHAHRATSIEGARRTLSGDRTGRRALGIARRALLVTAVVTLLAACGSATGAPSPTPTPTATATPDPHLSDPASIQEVYDALLATGIRIQPSTATSGGPSGEPRKSVNATYDGWPLVMREYSSSAALAANDPTEASKPGKGDPPFTLAGLNLVFEYGPSGTSAPPSERALASAQRLADALDPLIGPLRQRSVVPLSVSSTPAAASPSAAPSGSPATTP
jgi:hypothetical protein